MQNNSLIRTKKLPSIISYYVEENNSCILEFPIFATTSISTEHLTTWDPLIGQILHNMLYCIDPYCIREKYNMNIILKPYKFTNHLPFLPNNVGYINISELSIKPEDTKSPAVAFSVNYNLDLFFAFHFHYHYKRVLFGLLLPWASD